MGLKIGAKQDFVNNPTGTDAQFPVKGNVRQREVTEKTSSVITAGKFAFCLAALGALGLALNTSFEPKPYVRPIPSDFGNLIEFDDSCEAQWRDICVESVLNYQVQMPEQTEYLKDYLASNFNESNKKLVPDPATETYIVASVLYSKDKECSYLTCRGSPTETEGPGKTCVVQYNPQYITPKIPADFPKKCFQKILFHDHHEFNPDNVNSEKSEYFDSYANKIKKIECKFQVSHCYEGFEQSNSNV